MIQTELEQRILETAEKLFLEKGFAGVSTTDIARAVGCNQALVHYYYRTKEKLFRGIFENKVGMLLNYLDHAEYDGSFMGAITQLVDFYFEFLTANPRLPFFVLNELILNEERRKWMRETFVEDERRRRVYFAFSDIVRSEIAKGTIRQIEPLDLLLDVASLTVMTFISMPIYIDLLCKTQAETTTYLNNRKQEILKLLLLGLKA